MTTRKEKKKPGPGFPKPIKITARISSIANAFVNSVIPVIEPTAEYKLKALSILGMTEDDVRCTYCGDPATEWDHLKPLVSDTDPTGFIHEIFNWIPACGKCNQSKGNKPWDEWIESAALKSPATRKIENLEERKRRIRKYERWASKHRHKLDVKDIVGALWDEHKAHRLLIEQEMKKAQKRADVIRAFLIKFVPGSK